MKPNEEIFKDISKNLEYFDYLKIRIHTNSFYKIAYHWRKYIKRKKALLEEEEKKKMKKKTKGKKGS